MCHHTNTESKNKSNLRKRKGKVENFNNRLSLIESHLIQPFLKKISGCDCKVERVIVWPSVQIWHFTKRFFFNFMLFLIYFLFFINEDSHIHTVSWKLHMQLPNKIFHPKMNKIIISIIVILTCSSSSVILIWTKNRSCSQRGICTQ